MKNSTKYKIIKCVKRALNYQEPFSLSIIEEKRKIHPIHFDEHISDEAYKRSSYEQLNHIAAAGISIEMQKLGIIKVKILKDIYNGGYSMHESIHIVDPPPQHG